MRILSIRSALSLIIGGFAGFSLGWARLQMPEDPGERARTLSQSDFEFKVQQPTDALHGLPVLRHVQVHPMLGGGYAVRGDQLFSANGKYGYQKFEFDAKNPFVPSRVASRTSAAIDFLDFLFGASQKNPDFVFHYSWWEGPQGIVLQFLIAGGLAGLLWPIASQLLVSGTFASPPANVGAIAVSSKITAYPDMPPAHRSDDLLFCAPLHAVVETPDCSPETQRSLPPPVSLSLQANAPTQCRENPPSDSPVTLAEQMVNEPTHYAGDFYPTEIHTRKTSYTDSDTDLI